MRSAEGVNAGGEHRPPLPSRVPACARSYDSRRLSSPHHTRTAPPRPARAASRSAPPPWPLRVLRSSQLDALRLDDELLAMLREQFARVFAFFQPVGV